MEAQRQGNETDLKAAREALLYVRQYLVNLTDMNTANSSRASTLLRQHDESMPTSLGKAEVLMSLQSLYDIIKCMQRTLCMKISPEEQDMEWYPLFKSSTTEGRYELNVQTLLKLIAPVQSRVLHAWYMPLVCRYLCFPWVNPLFFQQCAARVGSFWR